MKKFIYILPLVLIGCTSPKTIIKEVPVEVVKTEYKDVYHFDSIYLKENVYVYQKGDTIFKDSIVRHYVEKQIHDTLITHDTIPQIIYQDRVITKKVPQWWPVWLVLSIVVVYFLITKTKFISNLKEFVKYIINLFK
jgi:hypothetical protein